MTSTATRTPQRQPRFEAIDPSATGEVFRVYRDAHRALLEAQDLRPASETPLAGLLVVSNAITSGSSRAYTPLEERVPRLYADVETLLARKISEAHLAVQEPALRYFVSPYPGAPAASGTAAPEDRNARFLDALYKTSELGHTDQA